MACDRDRTIRLAGALLRIQVGLDLAAAGAAAVSKNLHVGIEPRVGEFAARNRVGLGLAFTNVPQAIKPVENYREHAARAGWTPAADDIIYRVIFHVADTDEQAIEEFSTAAKNAPRGSLTFANRDLEKAVDGAGYYGRDRDAQRQRLMPSVDCRKTSTSVQSCWAVPIPLSSRSNAFTATLAPAFSTSRSPTISAKKPCTRLT